MRRWSAIGVVALLLVPAFTGPFGLHLTNLTLIAVIGALALNIVTGYSGQVSLGHAAFYGVGAFSAAIMARHVGLGMLPSLVVGAAAGGVLGALVGLPSLRFKGIYLAITTLAMHYGLSYGFETYQTEVINTESIVLPPATVGPVALGTRTHWFYLLVLFAGLALIVSINLVRSRTGRAWIALADGKIAAEALGLSGTRYRLSAFVVSSAMAAVAGTLEGYYVGVVGVDRYNLELAIVFLAMVVVGGMGSILGSVLGAITITLLPYALDAVASQLGFQPGVGSASTALQGGVVGLLIAGFLLFEPGGLNALWLRLRRVFSLWPLRYLPLEREAR